LLEHLVTHLALNKTKEKICHIKIWPIGYERNLKRIRGSLIENKTKHLLELKSFA
jgi:hypothetical protein